MSLKKRDRSGDGDGSEQESKREKRRRQRELARRQKALAATERKRRKEAEKDAPKEESDKPEKATPAKKAPTAKQPTATAKKPTGAAKKPATSKKPAPSADKKPAKAKKPAGRDRRRFAGGVGKAGAGVGKVSGGIAAVVGEVLKLGREMLVIPLQLWLGLAEIVGRVVLLAWLRAVLPALRLGLRALRALLHFGERHVTPARALAVVALVAIAALIASQWRDYSAISVGVDAYSGDVGSVAPAPEVSSAPAHEAHGWWIVVLGALAVVALVGAFAKRRRLGIWLAAIGVAVLVISLAVDAPKGLDEGDAAVTYQSASATLLSAFWLQIAAAVVLIACGLMLPSALRPAKAAAEEPELGPSLFDRLGARVRTTLEKRRARPKRAKRRLPRRLRRPAAKGKVQGAGT